MTKLEKLRQRFLSLPADFSWNELMKLLDLLGYVSSNAGKTSGSRVRFTHIKFAPIILHKPHPTSIVKIYVMRQLKETLIQREKL